MKKNARAYYEEAREIQGLTTQLIREYQTVIRPELSKINQDQNLTEVGKKAKADALKKEYGIKILQNAQTMKEKHSANLIKARKAAEKTIHTTHKKPDAETVSRFEKAFKALKTELMLTPRADTAQRKLNEFMAKVKDPWIAEQIRSDFADVAGPILNAAGSSRAKYQLELAAAFEKLDADHATPEIVEAREVLHYVEHAEQSNGLFSGFIEADAVKEMVGHEYASYLNKPEEFFAQEEYKEAKPAEHVDPELDLERRIAEGVKKGNELNAKLDLITKQKIQSGELKL
ncbi:hypothetical protein [Fictibacillus enclensis]|uniref:hypothetical protein n=1 Tax=Fictibacillus enclensis TaxID=1017270 RepID=UPI0024BF7359|nr:hypothetical protein [Fictibacillus enclensis]WHY73447.1 hypothetical protein QNH15_05915 [Fictibacillus enclensis]